MCQLIDSLISSFIKLFQIIQSFYFHNVMHFSDLNTGLFDQTKQRRVRHVIIKKIHFNFLHKVSLVTLLKVFIYNAL